MKQTTALLILALAALACTKQVSIPSPVPTLAPTYTPAPTVTLAPPPLPTSARKYVVVRGPWNCREFANTGAPVIYQIEDGTVVEIIQQSGGWTQVRVDDGLDLCWIAGY